MFQNVGIWVAQKVDRFVRQRQGAAWHKRMNRSLEMRILRIEHQHQFLFVFIRWVHV